MGKKIVSWRAAGNGPTCIANCPTQGLAGSCGDSTSNKCGRRVSHNRRALQHTAEASMQHPMSDCRGEDLLIGEKKKESKDGIRAPQTFFSDFFFLLAGGSSTQAVGDLSRPRVLQTQWERYRLPCPTEARSIDRMDDLHFRSSTCRVPSVLLLLLLLMCSVACRPLAA